ncbi:MAG: hypothetical protein WA220_06030 [Candidatus Nitrosopolaris sp.]
MNSLIRTIVITISLAVIFLILNPTPNIAKGYSCSSSSSTSSGPNTSGVSGTKGSCGTGSTTSTSAEHVSGGTLVGPNTSASGVPARPGIAESFSSGGAQSSCSSAAGGQKVGLTSISQQGSCSAHSP